MTGSVLDLASGSDGHFVLESGLHTDRWLDLEPLFTTAAIEPFVDSLAERLRRFHVDVVCGPLVGGAFLAQRIALRLRVDFTYAERTHDAADGGLYLARYRVPDPLRRRLAGRRVAVVDDAISAGSSVRATVLDLVEAGAEPAVVGTLALLGTTGAAHLAAQGLPVESVERHPLSLWPPATCPLCHSG